MNSSEWGSYKDPNFFVMYVLLATAGVVSGSMMAMVLLVAVRGC